MYLGMLSVFGLLALQHALIDQFSLLVLLWHECGVVVNSYIQMIDALVVKLSVMSNLSSISVHSFYRFAKFNCVFI